MYEQRIKTVRRNLANRGLEQMLVCDPRSIHYLTGAFIEPGERFLGLIVGSDARPTLVLNALFAAPADAACTVRSFTDTDDPLGCAMPTSRWAATRTCLPASCCRSWSAARRAASCWPLMR